MLAHDHSPDGTNVQWMKNLKIIWQVLQRKNHERLIPRSSTWQKCVFAVTVFECEVNWVNSSLSMM
jgi:hypothetical protein